MFYFIRRTKIFVAAGFSFLLLFGFTISPGQDNTVYWNAAHRLNFADFRGKQRPDGATRRVDRGIAGTIIKSIVADTKLVKGKTFFIVYASMKPDLSWIAKKGDSTALRHEQGHFDICEIYARILRRRIGQSVSVDDAKKMWNRVLDQEETEQSRYDKENGYLAGGITVAWKIKIRKKLKELDDYSRPEVPAVHLH